MLDVLLINPPYSFTDLVKLKGKRRNHGFYLNYPHLGLGYLASTAEGSHYSVEIIDSSANLMDEREIVRAIKEKKPRVVGITVTIQTSQGVYRLINKIKRMNKHQEIIVGGPHVSALPESVGWMGVDYGMIGEGEDGFVKFLNYIISKEGSLKSINGLVYFHQGKLRVNSNYPIKNLDKIPYPNRKLMRNDRYFSPVLGGRMTTIITSRGCPFNCTYCSRPSIGLVWRFRSARNVVGEMKEVVTCFKVKYIEFVDDTFTINRERIVNLCKLINKEKIKVGWGGQTRANLVDYSLLKRMKKAGCIKLSFGLETGVERIRYSLNKRIPDTSYIKAIDWCRSLGIETNLFVMFGHPDEKLEDMQKSIDFTLKLDPDYAAFYITSIFPGSILSEISLKEKRIKSTIWKDYMLNKSKLPAYIPDGLKMKDLENIHKKAFRKFYLRPSYIIKRIKKINNISYLSNTVKSGFAIVKDYVMPLEL